MPQELEVKFYLLNRIRMEKLLLEVGAKITQTRVFERNLRFDTPDMKLTQEKRVLRLRQDIRSRMTYKGPDAQDTTVSSRQEIEFAVSDFDAAQHLLEALGYQISIQYEKYRTTYSLGEVEIVLDEMPFGNFLEIEGPDAETIRSTAETLGLNWEARCTVSYMELFERLRKGGLEAEHLTFELLAGKTFTSANFNLSPGDYLQQAF